LEKITVSSDINLWELKQHVCSAFYPSAEDLRTNCSIALINKKIFPKLQGFTNSQKGQLKTRDNHYHKNFLGPKENVRKFNADIPNYYNKNKNLRSILFTPTFDKLKSMYISSVADKYYIYFNISTYAVPDKNGNMRVDIGEFQQKTTHDLLTSVRFFSKKDAHYNYHESILDPDTCNKIIAHYKPILEESPEIDSKLIIQRKELENYLSHEELQKIHDAIPEANSIILRKTIADPNQSIPFHTDVGAVKTLQIFLNSKDEYSGGNTVYQLSDALGIPERIQGCAISHSNTCLHAVTAIESGTRWSLFFLQKPLCEKHF
jgi:hypothetical protein